MTPSDELIFDLAEAVESHANARPQQVAFEAIGPSGRVTMSWRCFADEVQGLSQCLLRRGIAPEDRVAILMENQPRWGVAFLAIHRAGGIAVPLDTMAGVPDLGHVIGHAQATFLIASPKFHEQARALESLIPLAGGRVSSEEDWEMAIAAGSESPMLAPPRSLEDNLAILYTGGTTGAPKGVLLTLRNVARSIVDMLAVFPLSPADRILCVLPLYHVMPLLANLLAPLSKGSGVVYLNQLDPESLRRTFSAEGVTAFICVPQFYYQMQRRILEELSQQSGTRQRVFHAFLRLSGLLRHRFGLRIGRILFRPIHKRFGKRLRAFAVGGAYFNPKTAEFFADLGFQMFQAYGLTECAALATVTPLDRYGGMSCGPAAAHCELRVLDPDASGIGEILVRGESIMRGYWRDADATAAVVKDGWLHTGDLGTLDSKGALRITGRAKDVIILSSGKNVFPEELEEHFQSECDLAQEVCFVGVDGPDGTRLHCTVCPKEAASHSDSVQLEKRLRTQLAAAAKKLPAYKRPGSVQILNVPLPRTTTRKVQRFRVRQMAVAKSQDAVPVTAVESLDSVEREIAKLIRRLRPDAPAVHPGMHFDFDLRFDSLERVELLSNVEKTFTIHIPDARASEMCTVQDLIDEVRKCPSGQISESTWTGWKDLIKAPLSSEEGAFATQYLRRRPLLECCWYSISRIVFFVLHLFTKLRVHHATHLPDPPFMICPNHVSYLDTPAGACKLPYAVFSKLFGLGRSSIFRSPIMKWVASICRIVPVDAEQNLMHGIRMGKAGLERGLILWVYPEGTRSFDGKMQELRRAPALLSRELQIPVVPMGIAGTFEVWPRGKFIRRLTPIAIATGSPLISVDGESEEVFNRRLHDAIENQVRIAESLRA